MDIATGGIGTVVMTGEIETGAIVTATAIGIATTIAETVTVATGMTETVASPRYTCMPSYGPITIYHYFAPPFLTRSKKLSLVSCSCAPRPRMLSFSFLFFGASGLIPACCARVVAAASAFFEATRIALNSLMTGLVNTPHDQELTTTLSSLPQTPLELLTSDLCSFGRCPSLNDILHSGTVEPFSLLSFDCPRCSPFQSFSSPCRWQWLCTERQDRCSCALLAVLLLLSLLPLGLLRWTCRFTQQCREGCTEICRSGDALALCR